MSSRTILTITSLLLFAVGGLAVFAADEVADLMDLEVSFETRIFAEFAGIGMLALAIQNWMSPGRPIGGVYARPLGLGNLLFFSTSALGIFSAAAPVTCPCNLLPQLDEWGCGRKIRCVPQLQDR